jgi:hypothetical protein
VSQWGRANGEEASWRSDGSFPGRRVGYHRAVAFRDDREVLKQRAQELEQSLAEANKKLDVQKSEAARAKQLEAELAAARATLDRIEGQLPKKSSRSQPLALGAVALVGAAAVAGGAWLLGRPSPGPMPSAAPTAEAAAASGEGIQLTVDLRDMQKRMPAQSGVAVPSPAPPPAKEVTARWLGKAKTVTGLAIKPGAGCSVDAVLRSNNRHEVTVRCGDEVLYRSTDKLEGTAHLSAGVQELLGDAPGTARAAISWGDIGARNGPRAQASINSEAHVASAWRDTAPPYRVDIELSELSEPYQGAFDAKHSHDALPFKERVERRAKVQKTTGKSPLAVGAQCTVSVGPSWDDECRAKLTCGTRVLYGANNTGFAKCEVAEGKPTLFRDDSLEGDPMLTWDVVNRTIALVVDVRGDKWSADFSVASKP